MPIFYRFLTAATLCVFSASICRAEVSMNSSPVQGNPVDLAVNWSTTGTMNVTLVISPVAGQIQGSCYIGLMRSWQGLTVRVYDTTTGNPENPQYGIVGWQYQPLSGNACSVDVAASSWSVYTGFVLRITMNSQAAGNNQVVASYDEYVTDGETYWYEWTTATIGNWNSGPAAGAGAVLTDPPPGSTLYSTSATFVWTAAENATQYCLDVGTTVGGSNLSTGCTTGLSKDVADLPSTGAPFYITLTTTFSGSAPVIKQYAVKSTRNTGYNSDEIPIIGSVYNNGAPVTFPGGYCSGVSCMTANCWSGQNNVNVFASNQSATSHTLTVTANGQAETGTTPTITCSVTGAPNNLKWKVGVWDATPVITSITHFSGGGSDFFPGEGTVGVRITGTNLGHCGTLDVQGGPGVSIDISLPGFCGSGQNITYWSANEIDAIFNIDSTAEGTYTIGVTVSLNVAGHSFQSDDTENSRNKATKSKTITAPTVRLIQFGVGNSQEIWRASTFASNGDALMDSNIIWKDPNGNGNVTVNDPAVLIAGRDTFHLKDVVLRTTPAITGTAQLKLDVSPGDLSFVTVSLNFVNGQATIPNINVTGAIANKIVNGTYQFQWSIRIPYGTGAYRQFRTTNHKLYFIHDWVYNIPGEFRVTTKRIDYVTNIVNQESSLASIALKLANQLSTINPKFNGGFNFQDGYTNYWVALEAGHGYDCLSLSKIAAAQLRQLGYSSANVNQAYTTGALPEEGDTDATTQESKVVNGDLYSLVFDTTNLFEGYVVLSPPDTLQPMAFTIEPVSPLLGYTGCAVSPATPQNRTAFRVLTSTYDIVGVGYLEWLWDDTSPFNLGHPPPPPGASHLPETVALPYSNCL